MGRRSELSGLRIRVVREGEKESSEAAVGRLWPNKLARSKEGGKRDLAIWVSSCSGDI
jgi:hypothetical protein